MREDEHISIGRFANLTGLSRSTLIFYDKIGVFSPAVRNENGYRFYLPRQIVAINRVTVLRSLGIPLETIRLLSSSHHPLSVLELFRRHSNAFMDEVHRILALHDVMFVYHHTILAGMCAVPGNIEIRDLDRMRVSMGDVNVYKKDESFYGAFLAYCREAKGRGVNLAYPIGGCFESGALFKTPGRPTRFYSLDGKGDYTIPAGRYLLGYIKGYYGESGGMELKMERYAKERGLRLGDAAYCLYLLDEISVGDPNEYLLQISIPIVS